VGEELGDVVVAAVAERGGVFAAQLLRRQYLYSCTSKAVVAAVAERGGVFAAQLLRRQYLYSWTSKARTLSTICSRQRAAR
jgi:hypoxanthine phosphoribosyltransferase